MDGRRARIVLGVSDDAGPDEIRHAFRARSRASHPDHGGLGHAFAELHAARDELVRTTVRVPAVAPALPPAGPRLDVYDSPRSPRARRDFADVLRAATAQLASGPWSSGS